MARLRNVHTGVVVNVADEKVARFDSQWEPADPPAKVPAKKAAPARSKTK